MLRYKGQRTDSKGYEKKTFRRSESDCKSCSLREACYGKMSKFAFNEKVLLILSYVGLKNQKSDDFLQKGQLCNGYPC